MNIAGRWVPLAVANTIFILWAVAIAVLGIVVGVRLISVQKVTVRIASNGAGVPA